MKGDYEEFNALRRRKNKANSKPNKLVPSAQAIPKAFGFEAATRSCSPRESIRSLL